MLYTIAKISGMYIRTLRFYDEIDLFKPAAVGDNKYRYYQESQLLVLQQILFYKELGFSLKDIRKSISADDFYDSCIT